MANTTIQLKYSTQTSTPTSLNIAEPAYSYASNTLFIGTPDGTSAIAIGGKFYVDQQAQIFIKANAAFDAANSAVDTWVRTQANSAFNAANSASSYANAAFLQANTPSYTANSAAAYANAAFTAANTAQSTGTAAGSYANSAYTQANTATSNALAGSTAANAAFAVANSSASYANSGFAVANSAASYANSAFTRANNSINANTGGTITADLVITGNLTVQGNTTYVDTRTITSGDSLIHLANNNTVGDTVDIGFYGSYNSGGVKYTGLVRQAGANYFLFKDLTSDPTANVLAPGSLTAANTGTLTANLTAYSVTINGQDINLYTTNAYTQANTALGNALAASTAANAAFAVANTASSTGTSAGSYANSAYAQANTATSNALAGSTAANAAFATANSAASYANSAFLAANTPSYTANSAAAYANAAFAKANTDVTTISTTAGDYGVVTGGFAYIPGFKLEANGRISQANSTLLQVDTSMITSGTFAVARGGTGASSFTNNGVLLGQGTSALTTASSSTEGHVLTINSSGVPTFAHLQGGTF